MREGSRIYAVLLAIFVFYSYPSFLYGSGSASENYSVPTSVFSGGSLMGSDNFRTNGTIGQPSPLTDLANPPYSSSYDLYPGFWYTIEAGLECGNLGSFAATFGLTDSEAGCNPGCDWEPGGDVDGVDLAEYADSY